jgi:hypothetical protein
MHSNAAALDNIEKLIISILAVIPSGYTVGSVSNPVPMTIGASEILAVRNRTLYAIHPNKLGAAMPTTVITGRDLALDDRDRTSYDAQAYFRHTFEAEHIIETYQTL